MIKNTHYSYDYSQPDDYRFSLDSVFLAQKVALEIKNHCRLPIENLKVLDLCAGCGVIGLELNFHVPEITQIDFLEIQACYQEHFEINKRQARIHENFQFLQMNYDQLKSPQYENYYDIIVSNPPYFFLGEGLLSPNEFKNRCRFFIDSSFENLVASMLNALKAKGSAFVLMRPGDQHGRELVGELKKLTLSMATVEIFDEVRGTLVIRLIKKS